MAYLKSAYQILTEAAASDLNTNFEGSLTESSIMKELRSIDEVSSDIIMTAEMVPVVVSEGAYLADMGQIGVFMKDNEIKSVAEALNMVARANNMSDYSVGLLIESDNYMHSLLEAAKKKKNKEAKNKALAKLKGVTDLTDKLKKKGFKVKKKKCKKDEEE